MARPREEIGKDIDRMPRAPASNGPKPIPPGSAGSRKSLRGMPGGTGASA